MPVIGQFIRENDGFIGPLTTLSLHQDIIIVAAEPSDAENAPDFRVHVLDTMSNETGAEIGAGWKRDEWQAYGYGFPDTKARLARLEDDLEVITRMLAGDKHEHATFQGEHSSVRDAINVPKPIQRPRVPIMVGGNGPNVTWRLAARFGA